MSAMLRLMGWILALALVALPVVAVVNGWVGGERWPLRTLRVQGDLHRVDETKLRATVLPFAKRGFFAVQLDRIQAAVNVLPWVEHAEVRKHWPDVLEVRISEHRPYARWGKDRLLSEQGKLFAAINAVDVPKGLPLLDGPDARVPEVVALYNQARERLANAGGVRGVAVDRRGSWSITLASGTDVVLGRNDSDTRLQRFAHLLPRLVAQHPGQRLARADLRYTNGFALVWAELPEAGDVKPATPAMPPLPKPITALQSGDGRSLQGTT
ncbi:cell division protein FtsQ/DivIB [Thermomonas sp.]|uniref:cell division protein FtsQ/DivIB n=1 Tax=Thermomonas sp. TaxID=1971895 RepID=UPI0024870489|nr:cell division protein FtsQ/DivIB [Thermomonas sp.]MDI1254282.1 cell division protein FtsQ/DivIB [Thermomonas sp.]